MASTKVELRKLEKQLTDNFKLTSTQAEIVIVPLQRMLKARNIKPVKVVQPLSKDETQKLNQFMRYLQTNYPISDAMSYHISQRAADTFFPPSKPFNPHLKKLSAYPL